MQIQALHKISIRLIATVFALLLFCASFNWYILHLTCDWMPIKYSKILICSILFLGLIFYKVNSRSDNYYTDQFNEIIFYNVLINLLILILNNFTIINQTQSLIYIYNGLVFVVTIMVFISAVRHGVFKQD